MDLNKINVLNHELSNFKNSIERLNRELDDIENGDMCEYDQLCETLSMDLKPSIYDIEYLHEEMKKLEKSGINGLYVKFEKRIERDYDGYDDYYIDVKIYGDKKYVKEKLDKRKAEIILEIENYNKRIEDYKEQLKVEVNSEN